MTPLVRLIVVNFNGGEMTIECLRRLSVLDWPADRLQVVLVDNASSDGVADRVERALPSIRVVRSSVNTGFAGGANLGLDDLGEIDYVGFVNNDAFPASDWLRPLVDALEADPTLGAAAPKIVLAPRFVPVSITSPSFTAGGGDPRSLGVMVAGLTVDGLDELAGATFRRGFHGLEHGPDGPFQWSDGDGELWVPFDADGPPPSEAVLRLRAPTPTEVRIASGGWSRVVEADAGGVEVAVRLEAEPFDVINNVGSRLVAGGWAGDRGFLEPDFGQYDHPEEVFGWCGAAVLLARRYLDDLGGFDDRLFLYYEDTDLSWRGRLRGWRYLYVPDSRVRHLHSATSGEGSALFNHYVDRNRLLVFLRNAPLRDAADAARRFVAETATIALRDVIQPTVRGQARQSLRARQKARSLAAFLRHAPAIARDRAQDHATVDRRRVASWAERP